MPFPGRGRRARAVRAGPAVRSLDLFDTARLTPGQVDAELLRCAEDGLVGVTHLDRHAVAGAHLDVQAQRLHLLDQHLEGLRDARLRDVLALDDGLVALHATELVGGLDGEQLLKGVGGAVRRQRPDLHLTVALASVLGLTAERLLGDHGVRTGRTRVDLVVDQVEQLQDVDVTNGDRVLEGLTGAAVEPPRLAGLLHHALAVAVRHGAVEQLGDLFLAGAVEDRRGDVGAGLGTVRPDGLQLALPLGVAPVDLPAPARDPPEVGLQDLADVHPARHAERVEDDVDRGAVLKERHVLDRQHLGDDALVAVPAGQLVAVGDLALLGHVDADQLVHARRELVALFAAEHADTDDLAGLTVRHLQRGVADLTGLLTEDRAQQARLRGQLGLALGRDLADQDVARGDLGADADDAPLVQVGQDLFGDVRDVPGALLRTQLGVAGVDLVLLDVDRGEDVVLHQPLAEDDRVFVVVALPRHERDQEVLPERHLAVVGAGTVGDDGADLDTLALVHDRLLVEARALVGALELGDPVRGTRAVVVHDRDVVGRDLLDDTGLLGRDDVAGVGRGAVLHARADQRSLAAQQRHRLALHVGAHERAVGVVVLEERDHRRRDRHHLARRDVDVVHVGRRAELDLAALPADQDAVLGEVAVVVDRRVGLGDDVPVLLVRGEVVALVGAPAVDDLAVRRLDEAERVDPAVGAQRADQADVRAFRRLDRAHAAVVRRVDVTDLHAGALTGQTARTQRVQAALVGQASERVGLVHELRQLRGAEELLDRRHDRADVDQGLRRDRLDVLCRHALADDALHAGQAQADLVLDELAARTDTAVAEVVDVVGLDRDVATRRGGHLLLAGVQPDEVVDGRDDVVLGQGALSEVEVQAELLVDLVSADLRQVVPLRVEVEVLEQRLRGLLGRRLARTQLAVDVEKRVVLPGGVVLLQGDPHRLVVAPALENAGVVPPQRLEQDGNALLALAVDTDADIVTLVDFELEPCTPRKEHQTTEEDHVGRLVQGPVEVDAGRTDQLRDDDTLGAVDDESALRRHEREVTHEHRLALDLPRGVVDELRRDEHRGGEGHVLVFALLDGVLRRLEPVITEREGHGAGEVFDGTDLFEDLLKSRLGRDILTTGLLGRIDPGLPPLVTEQPVKGLGLQREEVRDSQRLLDTRKRNAVRTGCGSRGVARGCQEWSSEGSRRTDDAHAR